MSPSPTTPRWVSLRRSRASMSRGRIGACLLVVAALGGVATVPASAAPLGVTNGSLEKVTKGVPDCFSRTGAGRAKVVWGLTRSARSGKVASTVALTKYSRGAFGLVPALRTACAPGVLAGATYRLSVAYHGTTRKNVLRVYRHSRAGWTTWGDFAVVGRSRGWTTATVVTPRVPAGTDRISFGLLAASGGTLVTDNYDVKMASRPVVNPDGELVMNGSLEAGIPSPTGWRLDTTNSGRKAVVRGSLTSAARSGARAYQVTVSGQTTGDVKLMPAYNVAPPVQPGKVYTLSVWYRSTSSRLSMTVFAHTASGWGYLTDLKRLGASKSWRKASGDLQIPPGVDAIAWGVSMVGNGTLVTDDYSTRKADDGAPTSVDPAVVGKWTVADYNMPIRAMHSTVLRNGKVLIIAGSGSSLENFQAGSFKAAIWDPVAGTFETLDIPEDMFCAGHVTLADGRVLIQGGTKSYPKNANTTDYGGLASSYLFDPDSKTFTKTNDAFEGHWYPTLTQLGNGDVWMAGGLKEDTQGSLHTEYFDAATQTWLPDGNTKAPQTWSFWGLYPHMFLMADGQLFYSGGHVFGDHRPDGASAIYNVGTGKIANVPGLRDIDYRDQSASVLLPPAQSQKVLITGGGNINRNMPAVRTTDIIDLKARYPKYVPGPNLPGPGKMYLNATTLPDRTVLVTNGGRYNRDDSSNVYSAAVYDPATNRWTNVAADPIGRNYHSTAVLLPDGRVGVLGSNPGDGSYEFRVSLYEPSYLFKGERPTLAGAPAEATYGQQIQFTTTVAAGRSLKWAQLVRPMSVTHQMDSNMRLVDLPMTVENGVVTATLPANANLLPPGPYMLTVTDSAGVPSMSEWVMVK